MQAKYVDVLAPSGRRSEFCLHVCLPYKLTICPDEDPVVAQVSGPKRSHCADDGYAGIPDRVEVVVDVGRQLVDADLWGPRASMNRIAFHLLYPNIPASFLSDLTTVLLPYCRTHLACELAQQALVPAAPGPERQVHVPAASGGGAITFSQEGGRIVLWRCRVQQRYDPTTQPLSGTRARTKRT